MKKILKGFTLAEVLITLGIIGVVAALTLPSLQINVNQQALSSQISKTYSQLSEGLKMYMTDRSLDEFDPASFNVNDFARTYLQVQYVCNGENDENCFAPNYTTVRGNRTVSRNLVLASLDDGNATSGFILKDGTTLFMDRTSITFDVNGLKGPNKVGYDVHSVLINNDGSIGPSVASAFANPAQQNAQIQRNFNRCLTGSEPYGAGCFTHLLRNNFRFDY